MTRVLLMIAALGLMTLATAGPAAATHTGLLFGASSRVVITMSEYRFSPATITIPAGESVDFVLDNKGIVGHVFMVYPRPKAPYKSAGDWWEYVLAKTYLRNMGEILVHTRGQFAVSSTSVAEVAVDPGKTVTLTFTPARKGTFEFACLLSTGGGSHYTAGMKGRLIVR